MLAYIYQSNAISIVPSFEGEILKHWPQKAIECEIYEPDYRLYIPSGLLRRMSHIVKMGVCAAIKTSIDNTIGGVIVGTGLGCYNNSALFTDEYQQAQDALCSPGAFIQSTDNTIAGQIGLVLNSQSYNITYAHKGIAFENALIDAMLCVEETKENILVGAVDEKISIFELSEVDKRNFPKYWLSEGSAFFLIGLNKKHDAKARILFCECINSSFEEMVMYMNSYIQESNLPIPDLILYGNSYINQLKTPDSFLNAPVINYSDVLGVFCTNCAIGVHLAAEMVSMNDSNDIIESKVQNVLVVNNFNDSDFGCIYISKV